ncbi:MAG: hypoxanthine phosphoribosyltransferase [Gemmataceae bacterium]
MDPPPSPVVPLISSDQVAQRVRELAQQISADYAGKPLVLVGVLKGAWVFLADLVRQLTIPVRCDFVKLSSYGLDTHSSGQVQLQLDVIMSLAGQDVLVVEDIIDTGLSMPWLLEHLRQKQPASLKLCVLLDKPARRQVPVPIDYRGFTIDNYFIVGYGIDWAERYRELPYIAYVPGGDSHDIKST